MIVLVPAKLPFSAMMSPAVLGEVVTVPPTNELGGAHTAELPFVTVLPFTSPA